MLYEVTAAWMTKHLDSYEENREQRLDLILSSRADLFRRKRHWWNPPVDEDDLMPMDEATDALLDTGYNPEDELDEASTTYGDAIEVRLAIKRGVKHFYMTPDEFRFLSNFS